jgi:MYXO-CTERM domain-containing protein
MTMTGRNAHPTVRWAAFGDGPPEAGVLEFAWTEERAGSRYLGFATVGQPETRDPSEAVDPAPTLVLLTVGTGALVAALAWTRRRRRSSWGT